MQNTMIPVVKFRGVARVLDPILCPDYKPKMVYGTGIFKDPVNMWLYASDEKQAMYFGLDATGIIQPETLGQFINKCADDGTELYTGDIVEVLASTFTIAWRGQGFWFVEHGTDACFAFDERAYRIKLIGNIFEKGVNGEY